MRVTRPKLEAHRRAILDAAAGLFRSRGLDGVGIAEISQSAGLTHGAFYGHFSSKSALASAACTDAVARSAETWRAWAASARATGGDGLNAIVARYLSEQHRDAPERGCFIASLAPEASRGEPQVRDALADGVTALANVLRDEIAKRRPNATEAQCRAAALATLAAMVGGITLARALADAAQSGAALRAAAAAALAAADIIQPR